MAVSVGKLISCAFALGVISPVVSSAIGSSWFCPCFCWDDPRRDCKGVSSSFKVSKPLSVVLLGFLLSRIFSSLYPEIPEAILPKLTDLARLLRCSCWTVPVLPGTAPPD
ncbi:hypothetical protein BDV27DRAFT_131858 [Aspergillus caelatus]|uniref:Uncharacterized protein n=1 Tax=Aspergillus caelatus TaxID=61420 RepID=A0A5N7A160_9EURO|nr:uncharacterized protein BDV27DRAFT_131858 [Aspergillus caelatus]KAE8362240.1 hypothetical protein BDV27DRAFT_131858 [Aspergillus caelatus]